MAASRSIKQLAKNMKSKITAVCALFVAAFFFPQLSFAADLILVTITEASTKGVSFSIKNNSEKLVTYTKLYNVVHGAIAEVRTKDELFLMPAFFLSCATMGPEEKKAYDEAHVKLTIKPQEAFQSSIKFDTFGPAPAGSVVRVVVPLIQDGSDFKITSSTVLIKK